MTDAAQKEKKKTPCPFEEGDIVQRAGFTFLRVSGPGNYSGSLHTEQWLLPATYHDGSDGSFVPNNTDKKVDPEKVFVVFDADKKREAIPISLYAFVFAWFGALGKEFDPKTSEEDLYGMAEVILADRLSTDSIMLDDDYRLTGDPDDAAIVTVADLFE